MRSNFELFGKQKILIALLTIPIFLFTVFYVYLAYYTSVVNGWSLYTLLLPIIPTILMKLYRLFTNTEDETFKGYTDLSVLQETIYLGPRGEPTLAKSFLEKLWSTVANKANFDVPVSFHLYNNVGNNRQKELSVRVMYHNKPVKIYISKSTLERHSEYQLLGVMAHELYHVAANTLWIRKICVFLGFFIGHASLYLLFSLPSISWWLLIVHFLLSAFASFLLYAPIRREEYAADQFAKSLGFGVGLRDYLDRISDDYSGSHFSTHPPTKTRVKLLY